MGEISDDVVKQTFYNLMLDISMSKNYDLSQPDNIHKVIEESIKTICQEFTTHGYPTVDGHWVNQRNVHKEFVGLFQGLDQYRTTQNPRLLDSLVKAIFNRQSFQVIIQNLIKFYKDAVRELRGQEVNEETIQETFYNLMIEEVLIKQRIRKSALEDQDAFIYIGLSSIAILEYLIKSLPVEGISLQNGAKVTLQNCPSSYTALFDYLIKIKTKFCAMKFSDQELELIRQTSLTDPDLVLSPELEKLKTPTIMEIVALITSLAIQISSQSNFRHIIDNVIKFCLDADKGNGIKTDNWILVD